MMPMGLNSTRFISYHDINVEDTDLIEDAFLLNTSFSDVICLLHTLDAEPEEKLEERLIEKIRKYF
jgi:hypothetical protein